jgi:membrane protease subunit (stomatin/prohibitin family)
MLRDADFGIVRVRAFGIYSIQVMDAPLFFRELVGTDGHFKTSEIEGAIKKMLVSQFTTAVGKAKIPALDMAANYEEFATIIREKMLPELEGIGLGLRTFIIENISLPAAVEKAMDTRSEMGALGDMGRYTQFQTAGAIRDAAQNSGGGAGQAMGIGAGLGLGQAMASGLAGGFAAPAAPVASAPPAMPSSGPSNPFSVAAPPFHIHLNGKSIGPYELDVLKQGIASKQFTAATPVWREGMAAWTAAGEVDELKGLFQTGSTPPPFSPPSP